MAGHYSEYSIEKLAHLHQDAYDPYEPYCGVAALFNADLRAVDPFWAPRDDWEVQSPYEIKHSPAPNMKVVNPTKPNQQ